MPWTRTTAGLNIFRIPNIIIIIIISISSSIIIINVS